MISGNRISPKSLSVQRYIRACGGGVAGSCASNVVATVARQFEGACARRRIDRSGWRAPTVVVVVVVVPVGRSVRAQHPRPGERLTHPSDPDPARRQRDIDWAHRNTPHARGMSSTAVGVSDRDRDNDLVVGGDRDNDTGGRRNHRQRRRRRCRLPLSLPLILLSSAVGCLCNPDAKRLYDDLLSNYNRLIRPVSNNTDTVLVKLGLRLSQLIELVRIRIVQHIARHPAAPVRRFSPSRPTRTLRRMRSGSKFENRKFRFPAHGFHDDNLRILPRCNYC